jgi:hypothetical protein
MAADIAAVTEQNHIELRQIAESQKLAIAAAREDFAARSAAQKSHIEKLYRTAMLQLEKPIYDVIQNYEYDLNALNATLENLGDMDYSVDVSERAEAISREREQLIGEFLNRQKLEENRHLRVISSLACFRNPASLKADQITSVSDQIASLRASLQRLQETQIAGVPFTELDEQLLLLKDELDAVQVNCELRIESSESQNEPELDTSDSLSTSAISWLRKEMSNERQQIALERAQFPLEAKANAERLESQLRQEKESLEKDLVQQRIRATESIGHINSCLEEAMQRKLAMRECLLSEGPREGEAARIADLEQMLHFKTEYWEELRRTFQDCKRKIAVQETSYNCRFGLTPSVAVLRPGTAASMKMRNLSGKAARPLTAGPICRLIGIERRRESLRHQTL